MKWPEIYYVVRASIILVSATVFAGIFWAALIAGLIRWAFDLDEETALLWIALPIFLGFIPFGVFVLPKELRKSGIL